MTLRTLFAGLTMAALIGAGASVYADQHDDHHEHAGAGQFDEAAWYAANGPNENHARLKFFVGEWHATMRMAMSRDMTPEEGEFDSSFTLVMGGRFVEERVTSETPAGLFEARGLMGYDNHKQRYVSTWYDNMSTTVHSHEGYWDDGSKTLEFIGEAPDVLTGETKKVRVVLERLGRDVFTAREWAYEDDGSRWLRFAAEYRRKASSPARGAE